MSSMFRTTLIVSAFTAAFAFAALKQEGDGEATFDAKGTLGLKIHGVAKKIAVKDDGTNTTVTLTIKDVDTDNSLRNKHMYEDLESDKFPTIVLSVPTKDIAFDGAKKSGKGSFTVHGVTKEVPIEYTAAADGTVKGSAVLNLSDFGVKIRSYLGVTVKPDVNVTASFKVSK